MYVSIEHLLYTSYYFIEGTFIITWSIQASLHTYISNANTWLAFLSYLFLLRWFGCSFFWPSATIVTVSAKSVG